MRIKNQQIRRLFWGFILIPLIANYFLWLDGSSPSYTMSNEFEKAFWVVAPFTALVAVIQIDSGSYLPSLSRMGLPWALSYAVEKTLHAFFCTVAVCSFLFLLTAMLIRHAPNHYMSVRTANLEETRLIVYHHYWQLDTTQTSLSGHSFKIDKKTYAWLQDHRYDPINVRVKHNLAGASVTITPQ